MTTTPVGGNGDRTADNELYRRRQVAESFGVDPGRYDRTRPRYPATIIDRITATSPGPGMLDVGCGTGIVARQFREVGCTVLGVEPDARMAGWAQKYGLAVEVATFESWKPAGRVFDAVVSGQAWHWVDAEAGATKAAQVLRPGGRLAVFWNVDQPSRELAEAFSAIYRRVASDSLAARLWEADAMAGYARLCTKADDGMRRAGSLSRPEQWCFEWERSYTRDEWLDQLPTQGDHSQFPPEKLAELLARTGAAIDALGGGFTMRYTALAVTAVRIGDSPAR
jgi:SAM-dependent methyltransferase